MYNFFNARLVEVTSNNVSPAQTTISRVFNNFIPTTF